MDTLENLTLVTVFLTEGDIKSRDWKYYITQREGNFLYDFNLGDPVSDEFGQKCELLVENSQTRTQTLFTFVKGEDHQWRLLNWNPREMKISDLPANQHAPEAMGDAFDTIFSRYYREVESRDVPDKISAKPKLQEVERQLQDVLKAAENNKEKGLLDYLDQDLVDPVLEAAGKPGFRMEELKDLQIKGATEQLKRLRDVDQFLLEQMKEKDSMIKDLKDTIETNQKAFPVDQLSKSDEKPAETHVFKREVFLRKVWGDLTLRLAFPNEEKEKAIFEYFTQIVDTWLPLTLNADLKVVENDSAEAEPDDQEQEIGKKNFLNDLQEYDVYPGETKLLKDLIEENAKLAECVYDYIRQYGKTAVREWWSEYQQYSKEIDF